MTSVGVPGQVDDGSPACGASVVPSDSGGWSRLEHFGQLAGLVQVGHDVAAADQLAVDVELRIRGPVGVALQSLAQVRIQEDVVRLEVDADLPQDADDLGREATLRERLGALHEEHDLAAAEQALNLRAEVWIE